jgi:hypothetical protein
MADPYVTFDGNGRLETPDDPANRITGDIYLKVDANADWANLTSGLLINRNFGAAFVWRLSVLSDFRLLWECRVAGVARQAIMPNDSFDAGRHVFEATRDATSGQMNLLVDGVAKATVTNPAGSMDDEVAAIVVGANFAQGVPYVGDIYSAEVRSGTLSTSPLRAQFLPSDIGL